VYSPEAWKLSQGFDYCQMLYLELERLNGFDPGWTEGMPDGRRAFMMGNALVVGLVARVGDALAARTRNSIKIVS
jgi:hypothetical protein